MIPPYQQSNNNYPETIKSKSIVIFSNYVLNKNDPL